MSTTPKDDLNDLDATNADVTGGGVVKKVTPTGLGNLHAEPEVSKINQNTNYPDVGLPGHPIGPTISTKR